MRFTRREVLDLVIAWFGVSLAFTIATGSSSWASVFLASAIAAGLGVVVHELAHKIVANRMGYATRFVADLRMIVLGVIVAIAGWIILAPGGVRIMPAPDERRSAIIAIAGPLSNVAFAAVFIVLALAGVPFARFGALINAYLAVFNLLPAPGFDGRSVWTYNKTWSITAIAVCGLLLLLSFVL